jgi:hypothetical protein
VCAGVLRPDQHQQQLVAHLALLLGQLQQYSAQVKQYRAAREGYEVRLKIFFVLCCGVCKVVWHVV